MGRAEPLRMMMNHAGMRYDEVNIEEQDWPAMKEEMPGG